MLSCKEYRTFNCVHCGKPSEDISAGHVHHPGVEQIYASWCRSCSNAEDNGKRFEYHPVKDCDCDGQGCFGWYDPSKMGELIPDEV